MKYLVNTDSVELVIKSSEDAKPSDMNGFTFSSTFNTGEARGFLKCNHIHYKNQPFAKLYWSMSDKLRYRDRSLKVLVLNNETLYREGTFKEHLPLFLQSYCYKVTDLKQLHVSIDGPGIIKRHNQLFKQKNNRRKRKVSVKDEIEDFTKEKKGIYLGKYGSDKFVSIYNKTKELQKSRKEYILECWRKNGIDTKKEIDRLELRLRSRHLKGMANKIDLLDDPCFLASVFKSQAEGYLTFINQKNKKKSEVIPWKQLDTKPIFKEEQIVFHDPSQRIKSCIKTLYLENLDKPNPMALIVARRLLEKYRLQSWFVSKESRWLSEYPHFKNQVLLR